MRARQRFDEGPRRLDRYPAEPSEIQEVVVGLPLRLSGAEGTQSEKMRVFADDLRRHLGVTVHLWFARTVWCAPVGADFGPDDLAVTSGFDSPSSG